MYFASIDCGSTNSRVYILDEKGNLHGRSERHVGVRDTSIHRTSEYLRKELVEAFYMAVELSGVGIREISFVISAGMITSEIGLLEIPHLWAPVTISDLASHIMKVEDPSVFPVGLPLYFVRGIKNRYDPGTAGIRNVGSLDFMRGEETQMAGLLTEGSFLPPLTAVVLSSHTKFISIDQGGAILGSVTTLSGQLYASILKETIIGKSVTEKDGKEPDFVLDPFVVDCAFDQVRCSGLVRSLLMPRFLDTLISTTASQRKLFYESSIAAEDLEALNSFEVMGFPRRTDFVLIGRKERCELYRYLLGRKFETPGQIRAITEKAEIDMLNIRGTIALAKKAGLLE